MTKSGNLVILKETEFFLEFGGFMSTKFRVLRAPTLACVIRGNGHILKNSSLLRTDLHSAGITPQVCAVRILANGSAPV
jgi:hypothetical protein